LLELLGHHFLHVSRIRVNGLYSSPHIIRVMESRRMRWAAHVALMGRGDVFSGFWWGDLRERDHLEGPGAKGRIILRWIFRRWVGGLRLD
jgi:hypothetical protein